MSATQASDFIELRQHPLLEGQLALYAKSDILKGTVILDLSQLPIINQNNRYAVTLSKGKYIDTANHLSSYTNHSCEPNLSFDTSKLTFEAIKDLKKDEMLTFDYFTTEIEITEPFQCLCGSQFCRGYIATS